jgi:hypothetical protein
MAYRDVNDPRVAALRQQIATEPELLQERARIRRESDALQDEADRLGIEVAESERNAGGGVIAAVTGFLGGSKSPDDVTRTKRELDDVTAKLKASEADERTLQAKIDSLAAARKELSVLIAANADALRSSDGPLGDELRTLHAAMQADDEKLSALDKVIAARDRADSVISGVVGAQRAASAESAPLGVVIRTAVTAASIVTAETPPKFGVDAARARAHMPEGRERIADLVDLLGALRERFQMFAGDRSLDLLSAQLTSLARSSNATDQDATSAATCLERLLVTLSSERTAISGHRKELAAREREILEKSV